ncbi:hypothetical protein GCM10007941_05950 [Amphritea balenae]|nr:hypothetical protein GCM10007941_05950 [Amphritea balenae]
MSLISPSYRENEIAKAYGMARQNYSWSPKELAKIVLNPPDDSYQAERLSNTTYRVPPTYAKHLVWDVLSWEDFILYNDEESPGKYFPVGPIPRRH